MPLTRDTNRHDGDPNINVINAARSGKELDHVVDIMQFRKRLKIGSFKSIQKCVKLHKVRKSDVIIIISVIC